MRAARAVVVGEARLERATLRGRVAGEIATRARQSGVPCHAVVGDRRDRPLRRAHPRPAGDPRGGDGRRARGRGRGAGRVPLACRADAPRLCVAMLGAAALAAAALRRRLRRRRRGLSADKPLTKAQFIARADAICRDVKQAQQALHRPGRRRCRAAPSSSAWRRSSRRRWPQSRKGLRAAARAAPQAPRDDRPRSTRTSPPPSRLLAAQHAARRRGAVQRPRRRPEGGRHDRRAQRRRAAAADAYGLKDCDDVF